MGYWVTIFLSIVIEEHFIFRRHRHFDWSIWHDWRRLPLSLAALAAFLIEWTESIVSMDQKYLLDPIAKMVGEHESDLSIWLGSDFALVMYPPLRALELRLIGR